MKVDICFVNHKLICSGTKYQGFMTNIGENQTSVNGDAGQKIANRDTGKRFLRVALTFGILLKLQSFFTPKPKLMQFVAFKSNVEKANNGANQSFLGVLNIE